MVLRPLVLTPSFSMLLNTLLILFTVVYAQTNLYFDKSIPDEETVLSAYDFQMANVYRDSTGAVQNYSLMYNPALFEGDIVNPGLNSRTVNSFVGNSPLFGVYGVQRNAVRQTYLKWTDARIPYTISSQYSSFSRSKIAEAIEEYRKKTCIEFSPKSAADQDYIHIVPDDGCYSLVGRIGGKQPVSLGDGCIQKGIIIHELMHAVGFFHEQSRADRDEYVIINWSNVEAGLQDQFDKYSLNMIDHLGSTYDYGSVMHYAPTAFSKNGMPTIEPKEKGIEIGQRKGFSDNDLYKINKLYNCPQIESTGETSRIKAATKKPLTISVISSIETEESESENLSLLTKKDCKDRRRDCEFLVRAGHCTSRFSQQFMTENCPLSCNTCEKILEKKPDCQDTRSWCERWATSGMCTQPIFQDYMKNKCAKSCQLC